MPQDIFYTNFDFICLIVKQQMSKNAPFLLASIIKQRPKYKRGLRIELRPKYKRGRRIELRSFYVSLKGGEYTYLYR